MERHRIDSDAIEALAYDDASRRMRIRFTSGREYDFCNVPASVFREFCNAPSKGRYYHDHIRGRYRCG